MKSKDLKKFIKSCVRESLVEIFADMHLETLVENVLKDRNRSATRDTQDSNGTISQSRLIEQERRQLRESMRMDDDPVGHENPESVSQKQLEELGLYRDHSRFIK